jgi:hypothetical protein
LEKVNMNQRLLFKWHLHFHAATRAGLAITFAIVSVACDMSRDSPIGPVATVEQAIRGGAEAWLETAVAIRTTQCAHFSDPVPVHCTGLLISPTVVLVAAHCVLWPADAAHPAGLDPAKWQTIQVAVGCHNITTPSSCGTWVGLAPNGVERHPSFTPDNQGLFYDAAILHLAAPVAIPPTRLFAPARMAELKKGDQITPYGWGDTQSGQVSPVLKSIALTLQEVGSSRLYLPSNDVGLGEGDSGGPELVLRDGEWFSAGINSTIGGGVPVSYVFDWIMSRATDIGPQSYLPSAQMIAILN